MSSKPKANPFHTGVGWLMFSLLRSLERRISPAHLRTLLLPFACLFTLFERNQLGDRIKQFKSPPTQNLLPGPLTAGCFRQRVRYQLSRIVTFWPDRLMEDRWRKRIQITGLAHLENARKANRPVILACLHFGPPAALLRYWLRAQGIAAVFLVKEQPFQVSSLKRQMNKLSGFAGLPSWFTLTHLREARQFLIPGHWLMIAVDGGSGKNVQVELDGQTFLVSTGAIRLAASTGAKLMPCFIAEEAGWHFRVHFGHPTPSQFLKAQPDVCAAATHLLHEFLPVVHAHPEQCGSVLLRRFRERQVES